MPKIENRSNRWAKEKLFWSVLRNKHRVVREVGSPVAFGASRRPRPRRQLLRAARRHTTVLPDNATQSNLNAVNFRSSHDYIVHRLIFGLLSLRTILNIPLARLYSY